MTSKKVVLLLSSSVGVLIFFVTMYSVDFGICSKAEYSCRKIADSVQVICGIFPLVFTLSLITYKMRDEVFRAWWAFARWFVPVILAVTIFFENVRTGGYLNAGQDFKILVLVLLYATFALVSVVKIVRAYKHNR